MIRIDIKRTSFFKELSSGLQQEYFNQKAHSYLPNIDNIYYTVSFEKDHNDNHKLIPLLNRLEKLKNNVKETKESVLFFEPDLYLDYKSFNIYKYCLTVTDLYDIFILDYIPNKDTPRVMVQLRSYGLWLNGYKNMIEDSYNHVQLLFSHYGMTVDKVVENRIDYCYHTNAIQNMSKTFRDIVLKNSMKTTMHTWHGTGRVARDAGFNHIKKDYFALGERKSNYVFVRFYNKTIEVIEKGYKAYFFQMWLDSGLINEYDKFCFEYAYLSKNYEHIHKAKLEFYIKNGNDKQLKAYFKSVLDNPNNTITDIQKIAIEYMPECTTIMNVEFETKRKFYYLSRHYIDDVLCVQFPAKDVTYPKLNRLMTIMHNRHLFLDYLTHDLVRFEKQDKTYVDWWNRLRNVKVKEEGSCDSKLVREYGNNLDLEAMKKRAVNAIGSLAVYMRQSSDNTFVEDITDIFALINDNDKHDKETCHKFVVVDDSGEIINSIDGKALNGYNDKKSRKEKLLKNRFHMKTPEEERREKLEFARFEYNLRQEDKNGG